MIRNRPGFGTWLPLAAVVAVALTGCNESRHTTSGFTAGTDTLSTTDGSITFNATLGGSAPTLSANDSLHGSGNTLAITDTSSATSQDLVPAGLSLGGIPKITLTTAGNAGVDAGQPFDLSGFSDVTRFALAASGTQGDYLNVGAGVALTVQTASSTVDIVSGFASLALTGSNLATLGLTGTTGGVTLTDPAGPAALTIQASNLALTGGITDASNRITHLTLAGSGGTSTLDAIAGSALTTLTATGNVTLGSQTSSAALPAGLTTIDLSTDNAPSYLHVQGSGATVTLGDGDNTILHTGSAADTIIVGNGRNTITDHSTDVGDSITVGTGYNTIDLASHAGSVLHLGADANYLTDNVTPNVVIENATAGVFIEFTGISSLYQYSLESFAAADLTTLIHDLEASLAGNPRATAAQTFGGNTYIVASSTGQVGPTDTVIVELIGIHGINISGGQIVLTS